MGRYPTDQLMGRPLPARTEVLSSPHSIEETACGITGRFRPLSPTPGQVSHVLLSRPPLGPKTPLDLHV